MMQRVPAAWALASGWHAPLPQRLAAASATGGKRTAREQDQPKLAAADAKQLARSVRAMPIKIVCVAKGDAKASAFAEDWLGKLRRYAPAEVVMVKPNPLRAKDVEVAKQAEAAKVLGYVGASDRVILLDERGRDACSEDVALLIAAAGDDGVPLTFCIGGPFGHGRAVIERANETLRLSRLVLNHSVAMVVLLEQLYRGHTILEGSPYHH